MSDYDWKSKTALQKLFSSLLAAVFLIGFGYISLVVGTHHLITWADFSWHFFWAILKCIIIIALFPGIIFPVIFSFRPKRPYAPKHEFFKDWARVYTGIGKGGFTPFFGEDVEQMHLECVSLRDIPFFLVTVRFKPWNFPLLGRRGNERFGVPVKSEAELQPFRDWARSNQIKMTEKAPGENQRRS